ncbi:hypothetical protein BDFB_012221, partial [Asbolus verrucosus]
MSIDDIQDKGSILIVKIPDSKTRIQRTFVVEGETSSGLNIVEIYRKYVALRKSRYERIYKNFLDWCKKENIEKCTENCLLAFFEQHESKKSLWSMYSMLKLCLMVHNNIDISKFSKLIAFLKKATEHHKPKKSAVLDDTHIAKFLDEAPDCSYLMMKVALTLGISGALRREELCKMKPADIEFRNDVV